MRDGYGHPRSEYTPGTDRPTIPPMPVAWTPEIVRSMFPIRFGLGKTITFAQRPVTPGLFLQHQGVKEFPATIQGWIDLWTTAASTMKPDRYQGGLTNVIWVKSAAAATPFRNAEATLAAEAKGRLVLGGLVFLGGHAFGDDLTTGAVVDMRMPAHDIVCTSVSDGSVCWSLGRRQLLEIEASGPGAVTTGGYTATVGHGLLGDLGDRYAAQWMTDRFGRTTTVTFVRIETDSSELFFRSMTDTPDATQVALSPLRALARQRRPAGAPPGDAAQVAGGAFDLSGSTGEADPVHAPLAEAASSGLPGSGAGGDLVSRLERLAQLRDSGALSETEYQLAKTKVLL